MMFATIEDYLSFISPSFIPLLQQNDIIISGSTAVYYCMRSNNVEPDFIPNDIDLFISSKDRKAGENFFKSLKKCENSSEEKELHRKYEVLRSLGKSQESAILNVKIAVLPLQLPEIPGHKPENIKIDFVFLSDRYKGTTVEHIMEDFDLDICKCWYDGIKMHGPIELLREKKCTLTHLSLMTRPVLNIPQLVEYYDSIRNLDPRSQRYISDRFRTISRIRKYTERGFTIDTSKLETPPQIVEAYIRENIRKMSAEIYLDTSNTFKHVKHKIPTVEEFKQILENLLLHKPKPEPKAINRTFAMLTIAIQSIHFMHFLVGLLLLLIYKLFSL